MTLKLRFEASSETILLCLGADGRRLGGRQRIWPHLARDPTDSDFLRNHINGKEAAGALFYRFE